MGGGGCLEGASTGFEQKEVTKVPLGTSLSLTDDGQNFVLWVYRFTVGHCQILRNQPSSAKRKPPFYILTARNHMPVEMAPMHLEVHLKHTVYGAFGRDIIFHSWQLHHSDRGSLSIFTQKMKEAGCV